MFYYVKNLKPDFIKIACGTNHSCAISERGILYTFGRGNSFQLGHGDSEHSSIPTVVQELLGNKIEKVSCGDMHTLEVGTSSHDNKILMKSWGTNTYGIFFSLFFFSIQINIIQ